MRQNTDAPDPSDFIEQKLCSCICIYITGQITQAAFELFSLWGFQYRFCDEFPANLLRCAQSENMHGRIFQRILFAGNYGHICTKFRDLFSRGYRSSVIVMIGVRDHLQTVGIRGKRSHLRGFISIGICGMHMQIGLIVLQSIKVLIHCIDIIRQKQVFLVGPDIIDGYLIHILMIKEIIHRNDMVFCIHFAH